MATASQSRSSSSMATAVHNKMGFTADVIDPFTADFIQKCQHATQPVADLGCGFGIVAQHLLNTGVSVILNDISQANLAQAQQHIPLDQHSRLTVLLGDATTLNLKAGSLSGAMLGRWVHFLTSPEAFYNFFQKVHQWLEPEGVMCVTVHVIKQWCPPAVCREYENKRKRGGKWPGWVSTGMMWDHLKDHLPEVGYAFHPQELQELVESVGFRVDKCGLYSLAVPPHTIDQFELYENNSLGLVAVKPSI